VNGTPLPLGTKTVTLHRHDRLTAISNVRPAIGVMLSRVPPERMFVLPPIGITLEGSATPKWHMPDLSVLAYR